MPLPGGLTTIETAAAAVASGAVAAWGLVQLWARRLQETQADHAKRLEDLFARQCPAQLGRIVALEANEANVRASLLRIETSLEAVHTRIDAMTKELGTVVGRLAAGGGRT